LYNVFIDILIVRQVIIQANHRSDNIRVSSLMNNAIEFEDLA